MAFRVRKLFGTFERRALGALLKFMNWTGVASTSIQDFRNVSTKFTRRPFNEWVIMGTIITGEASTTMLSSAVPFARSRASQRFQRQFVHLNALDQKNSKRFETILFPKLKIFC